MALGYALESEILAAQKKYPEAAAAMREALAQAAESPCSRRGSTRCSWRPARLRRRQCASPSDGPRSTRRTSRSCRSSASSARRRRTTAGAASAYRAALAIEPDERRRAEQPRLDAERARQARGAGAGRDARTGSRRSTPNVIDTLGSILIARGDTQRGLAMLQQATNLRPADPRAAAQLRPRARRRPATRPGRSRSSRRCSRATRARRRREAEAEALLKTL